MSVEDDRRARHLAAAAGIGPDQPLVAIELGNRIHPWADAVGVLAAAGYQIGALGHPEAGSPCPRGVRDLRASCGSAPLLQTHLVLSSVFVICDSADMQRAACLTHTPSLRVAARDPFTAYPIRHDSLFLLATAIDLDSGRALPMPELLTEAYFRNTRNYGYRPASPGDLAAAVSEMIDGVRRGWTESEEQVRFRQAVVDAGISLGARVRHVVEWDAAGGFVGDGRLARVQAGRAL